MNRQIMYEHGYKEKATKKFKYKIICDTDVTNKHFSYTCVIENFKDALARLKNYNRYDYNNFFDKDTQYKILDDSGLGRFIELVYTSSGIEFFREDVDHAFIEIADFIRNLEDPRGGYIYFQVGEIVSLIKVLQKNYL